MCCSRPVSRESIIQMSVDPSAGSHNTEHQLLGSRASEDKSSSLSPSLPHASAVCFHPFSLAREGEREVR